MTEPVCVGVIGVGVLGWHHARHLASMPEARLVGVYDIRTERAAQVAQALGTVACRSREELFERAEAVTIAASTPAHVEVGLAALAAGLPVLMEKPMAISLADADELLQLAEQNRLQLQVGHVERFNGAIRAAEAYLGHALFIECERLAPFQPRGTDVPVVLDLMIHDLDLILHLAGGTEAIEVRANGAAVLSPLLDVAHARVEFGSGLVASVTASRIAQERVRRLRVYQDEGYLALDLASGRGEFLRLRNGWTPGNSAGLGDVAERIPLEAAVADALRLELTSFLRSVRGEEAVVVTGREGRAALQLALQVTEAVRLASLASHPES